MVNLPLYISTSNLACNQFRDLLNGSRRRPKNATYFTTQPKAFGICGLIERSPKRLCQLLDEIAQVEVVHDSNHGSTRSALHKKEFVRRSVWFVLCDLK